MLTLATGTSLQFARLAGFHAGSHDQILAVAASVVLRARAAEILHFRCGLFQYLRCAMNELTDCGTK